MLVLDDAGVGGLGVGVVDDGVALVVGGVQHLGLEPDAAVLQSAQAVVEIGVDGAGVDDPAGQSIQLGLVLQVIGVQADLHALQHLFHQFGVAAVGDALVQGVEIVVVVGEAHRQAADDKGRQFGAGAAPLLFGVALDQLFVDVHAHQVDGLLLQVFRFGGKVGGALFLDLGHRLGGGDHAPHLVEGVHVEGHVVDLAVVVGNGRVGVSVEHRKPVDVVPHFPVVGVEDVRAVAVDVDALDLLGVDVAGDVGALVHHQAVPAGGGGLAGKDRAEQAGADDQVIIRFVLHHFEYLSLFCAPYQKLKSVSIGGHAPTMLTPTGKLGSKLCTQCAIGIPILSKGNPKGKTRRTGAASRSVVPFEAGLSAAGLSPSRRRPAAGGTRSPACPWPAGWTE